MFEIFPGKHSCGRVISINLHCNSQSYSYLNRAQLFRVSWQFPKYFPVISSTEYGQSAVVYSRLTNKMVFFFAYILHLCLHENITLPQVFLRTFSKIFSMFLTQNSSAPNGSFQVWFRIILYSVNKVSCICTCINLLACLKKQKLLSKTKA